jgi:hypothetical protein
MAQPLAESCALSQKPHASCVEVLRTVPRCWPYTLRVDRPLVAFLEEKWLQGVLWCSCVGNPSVWL